MSSNLISDLTQINLIKTNIKNAIETKGQTVTNFASYSNAIENISSGSKGVKQYDSLTNMYADISNVYTDDLATVYYSSQAGITVNTEFQTAIFPETVVLDEAMSDYVELMFKAVDTSQMFDCWGNLDENYFSMECGAEIDDDYQEYHIEYKSQDGITYTRTRFQKNGEEISGNEIDFGMPIHYSGSEFNNAISKFIITGTTVFDGIFKYNSSNFIELPNTGLNANIENVWDGKFYGIDGVQNGNLGQVTNLNKQQLKDRVNLYSTLSILSLNNINSLNSLFWGKSSLVTVPNIDTSEVTLMNSMFQTCSNLTMVPNFDTSNVIKMSAMFDNCSNLVNVPNFNTSKVTNMAAMFSVCSNLQSIPNFDTSNVTDMYEMFRACSNLTTVPNFNTSKVTCMHSMFGSCFNLITVPNFDTSNVTDMYSIFGICPNLVDVPQFNTSNVTNISDAFMRCNNLSDASIQNIINMCLNSNVPSNMKTLKTNNVQGPFYDSNITNSRYSNRHTELTSAGWTF